MVRTRSSARGFLFDRLSQELLYQAQERDQEHYYSQDSYSAHSYHDDYEPETRQDGSPQYKENDQCRRHRLADNSPYTVEVKSYKRRK
jgi:hypothetical protein